MFTPPRQARRPRPLDLAQTHFPKGYVSTYADSRIPSDALADMTNMILEQDAIPRPRPSIVAYGPALPGTCIGVGSFIKMVSGQPERWNIYMINKNNAGTGKVYINKDGGSLTEIGGTYSSTAWTTFTQIGRTTSSGTIQNRVYISNGTDNMSFYDVGAGTITIYTALATPAAPTPVQTGMAGTNFTYYYKITANNSGGESAASASGSVQVAKIRDQWIPASEYITVSWSAVAGASSYNVYVSDTSGNECYLVTVTGLTYKDDGSVAINTFRLFPAGNSSAGPKLKYLWNSNNQLFGVGDPDNPSYLWYSGQGEHAGDFSPFNDGGYVAINYGGDSIPVSVRPFRDGKGNAVVTILSRGSAGAGRLHHVTFETQTVGDTILVIPNVYEANGQSGTTSPLAVVELDNSLHYPTGEDFKQTGTRAQYQNILSTSSTSAAIEPDVRNLNLDAMDAAVAVAHEGRIYYALPVGSSANNEIWVQDWTRRGIWYLRWTVAAKFLWLYEDNGGNTHFCVLTADNKIGEFTRAVATQDFSAAFRTRLASGATTYDPTGVTMASIEQMRFKLLYPKGTIQINAYGLDEDGDGLSLLGEETFTQTISFTGYGQLLYSDDDPLSLYSGDIGVVDFYSKSSDVVAIDVDEVINEQKWEVITEGADSDYLLSGVHTRGTRIEGLYRGD